MRVITDIDYGWHADYAVIDDFLSKKHLKQCQDYFLEMPRDHRWNCSENFVPKNYDANKVNPLVKSLYETYNPILLGMLRRLAPEKEKLIDGSQIDFVNTTPGKEWVIHNDLEYKLLSVVVYISPEVNTGTILYKTEKGAHPYEVEWKINRCFAFARNDNTWHSYKNTHTKDRNALIYNLVSRQYDRQN